MRERIFTTASDVYAWGIFLTELMNREVPFKDLDLIGGLFGSQFLSFVVIEAVRDHKMTPPLKNESSVPDFLKKLMFECLSYDRNARPSFEKICSTLNNLNAIHFSVKA